MSEPQITLELSAHEPTCRPGDTISGEFSIQGVPPDDIKAVELSVLWYTIGQGDEDLAVHYFERIAGEEGDGVDLRTPQRFQTELPNSPLSYDGLLVKVCWCVRVRLFMPQGKQIVTEKPFALGDVPSAKVLTS